jgi:hypothetical protein
VHVFNPRADVAASQTGDGVTHPAEFIFSMLGELNITADTTPALLVRFVGSQVLGSF